MSEHNERRLAIATEMDRLVMRFPLSEVAFEVAQFSSEMVAHLKKLGETDEALVGAYQEFSERVFEAAKDLRDQIEERLSR